MDNLTLLAPKPLAGERSCPFEGEVYIETVRATGTK